MSPFSAISALRRAGASTTPAGSLGGRDLLLVLAATLLTFGNFAPLLTVLPLWAASDDAGYGGVGAISGTMMATTVAVQFLMPWILARFGLRPVLAAGGLLLGAPTLAYSVSPELLWVLAVSAVRGVGFGMVVVAASALLVELVPAEKRGRASGHYGIAVGIAYVVILPVSVWYVQHAGFHPLFVATAVMGILIIWLTAVMSHPRAGTTARHARDTTAATTHQTWRLRPLVLPWVVMLWTAVAMGGVTAFLALAQPDVAPAALLVLSLGIMVGRWSAGVFADRVGYGRLMLPAMVTAAVALAGLASTAAGVGPAAAAIGLAGLYGASFGVVQNDTFVIMFQRAGPRGTGSASTVWNVGYDAGTGVGSVLVGLLATTVGVAGSFALTAGAICLIAAAIGWASRRAPQHSG